jgi:hypothetical protein
VLGWLLTLFGVGLVVNPFSVGQVVNPYSVGLVVNPFSVGQVVNPFSVAHVINPFSVGQVVNPFSVGQVVNPFWCWAGRGEYQAGCGHPDIQGRVPVNHAWDEEEPRLLVVEAKLLPGSFNENNVVLLSA